VDLSPRRSAPSGPPSGRLPGIDLLKIVLAVMVVGLHAQLWRQDHPLAGQLLGEGLFRLAVIAQQIHYRYFHGQTTNPAFAIMGPAVGYLEARCQRLIAG